MFNKFLIFQGIVICLHNVHQSRVFADSVTEETQNYSFNDVEIWGEKYPSCKGKKQSPMDIIDKISQNMLDRTVDFDDYDQLPKKATLVNDGDFLMLKMDFDVSPMVTITPDNLTFTLDCIVFHWGSDPAYGSDHSLEGKRAVAEVQTFFYDTQYSSFYEAMKQELGVLAIASLFQISGTEENGMTNIAKFLPNVTEIGSKAAITSEDLFSVESLGLVISDVYYSYNGSITVPPCTEGVMWIVDAEMKSISTNQLNALRNIKLKDGAKLNVRPTQPQNGRSITKMKM